MFVTAMFVRPRTVGRLAIVTALVAFAVVAAVAMVVLDGMTAYLAVAATGQSLYLVMSIIAAALLLVPALTVIESAASFTDRRRTDRLATLRLLDARPGLIRRIPRIESASVAAVGATAGVVIGALVSVPLGLVTIQRCTLASAGAHPSPVLGLVVVVAVTGLATWRSTRGQRAVLVDPLGARVRPEPEFVDRRTLIRTAIALGVVLVVNLAIGWTPSAASVLLTIAGIVLAMTTVRRAGPVVVAALARRGVRRARSIDALIASRSALEAPFATWRRVSGITMTAFVAVVASAGMALLAPESDSVIVHDVTMTVAAVLGCAYLLGACTVGVDEVGAVIDRRELYLALAMTGMPPAVVHRIRFRTLAAPLGTMSIGAAGVAALLAGPVALGNGAASSGTALVLLASAAIGLAVAVVGVLATRGVVRRASAAE